MADLLIIDDDASIRILLTSALEQLGKVETVGRGDRAIHLLAERRYDAVLLDLHMTPVDGFAVLASMRSTGGPNAKTPVFICSADRDPATRQRALGGAAYFLEKPLRPSIVATLVAGRLRLDPRRGAAQPAAAAGR